jgi:hypothetical protein
MTLSALIRKRGTGNLATAIPAIFATHGQGNGATVARITTAVANPLKAKTAPPEISPEEGKTAPPANVAANVPASSPVIEAVSHERRAASCLSCAHLRRPGYYSLGYCAAPERRDDLPLAYGAGHPLRQIPDDRGGVLRGVPGIMGLINLK